MDLHLHTPGSADYQIKNATYLDILKQAEIRGLNIIAFTDHNTIKGYSDMLAEVNLLQYLHDLGRAEAEETRRLSEYRRLLDKILVVPGFEFTATFGFHILGIFPPETPVRQLEHILLNLNIPLDVLETGNSQVGASADVLTAYRHIREAGGLAIAAHVNSSHGVAMRGMDFGGQTRIAYTQDMHLHALEVTDLEKGGRYTTARFFDGTKPGYPRRMRCVQGSDAHRLTAISQKPKDLGIGDRVTEILLPECSFEAIKEVFESHDFALTRPYRSAHDPFDPIQNAREEGESIVQSFHPLMTRKGGHLYNIIADVCAMANTNGGTIYIGCSASAKEKPVGVTRPGSAIDTLYAEIDEHISPKPDIDIDVQTTQKQAVIRIQVARGTNVPYAIDDNKIYLRDEAETTLAVRDEIVRLVKGSSASVTPAPKEEAAPQEPTEPAPEEPPEQVTEDDGKNIRPPLTGVEVVGTEKRRGTRYHMMRDLRNNNIIHNVTRSSARRLWHYAITQNEDEPINENVIQWNASIGFIRRYKKAGAVRYDLAQKFIDPSGKTMLRIYYGVTEDGMHGPWAGFISDEESVEEKVSDDNS
ncbi:MAG TPA: RNA-binding domain-containing protein [Aggregatilineales bacterium]|nr:RNA-binding domain-containing protein [Aggregatilineales bacterium]